MQRKIVNEMWARHALRADWGSINDGRAVLNCLYGEITSGTTTTTRSRAGDGRVEEVVSNRDEEMCGPWIKGACRYPLGAGFSR